MKKIICSVTMLLSFSGWSQIGDAIHCGYDFTSYIVVKPHEDGKSQTINGLKMSVCDENGNEVINKDFKLSWRNNNMPLLFVRNYKVDANNKRISNDADGKWFYYFADDHYLVTVSNTFNAEEYYLKIEDTDGEENGGHFKTLMLQLAPYNMYILCDSEERQKAMQFGRRMNKPLDIVLEKK
ncbi:MULTISPECIES: hypothetical protein [unclassified Flavobacterium]|uniref:hypothetical protein n=1 Tax=unclassified Flavobacterium TaxID=196869 RepID=UPI0013D10ADA|nr:MULTISPECIES: hypothetical protein [unclassified Flavobacterium]MBA5792414.1 hypothetical protein [Flavobacterium sp. xlx-221]